MPAVCQSDSKMKTTNPKAQNPTHLYIKCWQEWGKWTTYPIAREYKLHNFEVYFGKIMSA